MNKDAISMFFNAEENQIFKTAEMRAFYSQNKGKKGWDLPDGMRYEGFLQLLIDEGLLTKVKLNFPFHPETRYVWGKVDLYDVLMTLKADGYFSHFTAAFLHGLTDQIPKTIYLTHGQQRQENKNPIAMTQEGIDRAFKNQVRVSSNQAEFGEQRVLITYGMSGGKEGIMTMPGPSGQEIRVTEIAKTMIDIAVRPIYCGGIHEVLKIFQNARGAFSSNRLSMLLDKMQYVYPYHQVIGYYLDRAEYPAEAVNLFLRREMNQDFYLTHGMKDAVYVKKWRLYVPEGF